MIQTNEDVFVYLSLGLLFFHSSKRTLKIPRQKFKNFSESEALDFVKQNSDLFHFNSESSFKVDFFGTRI
ncbi:hypothetical protein AMR75_17420 [Vibrio fluvialis]|jgi:hypothetical protein|nr:hypothetical protein AMR75_17420 [Vibrio fluvialis]